MENWQITSELKSSFISQGVVRGLQLAMLYNNLLKYWVWFTVHL